MEELRLDYCDECGKLTNHIGDECQKCKAKELKINIDIDDDFERTEKKYKRNKFDDEENY